MPPARTARYGLTIIAFVGSVFSPYYKLERARARPDNHCAINISLTGPRLAPPGR